MNTRSALRVSDVMRSEIHTIDGLATVSEAMSLMRRHDVSSLVVPRRNADDEFGLIVVSDIAAKV
ncbi:MAG: CBS domain-containing protein, partial [Proteobacteria bacterium]|nr:CBS domain-containing protein [Pseudomonadota bacterium]